MFRLLAARGCAYAIKVGYWHWLPLKQLAAERRQTARRASAWRVTAGAVMRRAEGAQGARAKAGPVDAAIGALKRGAYDAQGDRVEADAPSALPKMKRRNPGRADRLDLARWMLEKHRSRERFADGSVLVTLEGGGL